MGQLKTNLKTQLFERRKNERETAGYKALGLTGARLDALDCTVINISKSGALVHVAEMDIVPARFKLLIPECGYICSCEVVRREGQEVGVKFLERHLFEPFKIET